MPSAAAPSSGRTSSDAPASLWATDAPHGSVDVAAAEWIPAVPSGVVANFTATATATGVTATKLGRFPVFGGEGQLTAVIRPKMVVAAVFSGGDGQLAASASLPVRFAAAGTFSVVSAIGWSRIAGFTGAGALSAVTAVAAGFTGSGTLSAVTKTAVTAGFTGSGTLSGPTPANFNGSGALSVAVTAVATATATFTGSGVLSSLLATFVRSAAFTGSGTLSASVTTPTGSVVAAASVGGDTTPLSCAKPSGTANGDLLLAWQMSDNGTYAGLTAPAGWTLLTGLDRGSNLMHLKIWYKVASSEGSTYSWPQSSGADGCVSIVTLRSVNTSTGTWLWATPTWAANSATRVAPSVSGAGSGAVLICSTLADMNNTAATWTPPSGMIEQADVQSTTWATQTVATLLGPPNPSLTRTFTCSSSTFWQSNGGIEFSIVVPSA